VLFTLALVGFPSSRSVKELANRVRDIHNIITLEGLTGGTLRRYSAYPDLADVDSYPTPRPLYKNLQQSSQVTTEYAVACI
jgi:hypothetical protein